MQRLTRSFRRLQGKLTLSYTLTSVVTFLLIEVTLITIIFAAISLNISTFILSNLKQNAAQAATYYVSGSPNHAALASWLHIIEPSVSNLGSGNNRPILLTVVDMQGQSIASVGSNTSPLETQLSPQNLATLSAVLHDSTGKTSRVGQDTGNTLVATTPIIDEAGKVQGALLLKVYQPNIFQLLVYFLQFILLSAVIVATIAAIAGMVFGYLTARGLTRRLKRLSSASDRWSRGDFAALAQDTSEDEIGQVARQLNRMAEQLQNLLSARQKLATLEERNRLARDLHDSVKQQVFAISMQIGATKVLLKRDVAAAEVRLNEADKLVRQAQQELTSLIRELRPVALEGKGLAIALRELVTSWTQQTDIVANLHVENIQTLSLTVEEALFRVAQEALSNVARHSQATLVQLSLTTTDEIVTLSIVDNGRGFDKTHQECLGVGLLSMQERMKALGGDIQIESSPGHGAHITAYCNRSGVSIGDVSKAAATASDKQAKDLQSTNSSTSG